MSLSPQRWRTHTQIVNIQKFYNYMKDKRRWSLFLVNFIFKLTQGQNDHHLKVQINAGEGMEKREPSYTVGGNVSQCSRYGEE